MWPVNFGPLILNGEKTPINGCFGLQKNRYGAYLMIFEPREKTGFRGFRPGPTQMGLYNHRR